MSLDTCPVGSIYKTALAFVDDNTGDDGLPDEFTCEVIDPARDTTTLTLGVNEELQEEGGEIIAYIEPETGGVYTLVFRGTGQYQASGYKQFLALALPTAS
jgi:hypothetical protein